MHIGVTNACDATHILIEDGCQEFIHFFLLYPSNNNTHSKLRTLAYKCSNITMQIEITLGSLAAIRLAILSHNSYMLLEHTPYTLA